MCDPSLLAHPSLNIAGPRFEAEVLWLNHARIASSISKLYGVHGAVCLFAFSRESLLDFFHCHLLMLGWPVACHHSPASSSTDSIAVYASSVFLGADSTSALTNGSVSLRVSMNGSLAFPSHRRSNVKPSECYVVSCVDFFGKTSNVPCLVSSCQIEGC